MDDTAARLAPAARISPWRAAGAAGAGTIIEYYDFQLYAVLVAPLSALFFVGADPSTALLSTLAVFGAAFLARPLGGVFFGWLGDRRGRTTALVVTVIGIGSASAVIGLLPTYAAIGLGAPMLLLLCRLLQGFFAGGEVTGAATYVAECSPPDRRGFFGAFNPAAATLGLSVATAVAGLTTMVVGRQAMSEWGWRIPFLLSIPLVVLCVWARARLEDSPRFKKLIEERKVPKAPLSEVFANHRRPLFQVIALGFAQNAAGYVGVVYLSTHLIVTLRYDSTAVFWLISLASLTAAFAMPLAGRLSDRVGRRPVLRAGLVLYIVLVPLAMWVATGGVFLATAIAVVVSMVPFVITQAVGYPLYAELFPTRVRYSGMSLGFNIATILGGATAPFIARLLTDVTKNSMAPAFYVMAAALVGLIALRTVHETANRQLAD